MRLNDVILKVGGEGGSVALYCLKSGKERLFSLDFISAPSGTNPNDREEIVSSWPAALELLARYPWHRLTPLLVHPNFQSDILNALAVRVESDGGDWQSISKKWNELFAAANSSDASQYQTDKPIHSSDTWLYDEVEKPTSNEDRDYLRKEMLKSGLSEEDIKDMF